MSDGDDFLSTAQDIFEQAQAVIAKGEVAYINLAGDLGREALGVLSEAMPEEAARKWHGKDLPDGSKGGNCFYATVEAFLHLIKVGQGHKYMLVTGSFHNPAVDYVVIHAWLECKRSNALGGSGPAGHICVNVSNATERPIYAMDKDRYYAINHVGDCIQREDHNRVIRMANRMFKNGDDPELNIDVSRLTEAVLRKTFYYAKHGQAKRKKI